MRINPTAKYGALDARQNGPTETTNVRTSTALVPIEQVQERTSSPRHVSTRPNASFVTHLIATAAQAPQTRTLRRATPTDAVAAYGRVTARRATISSDNENMTRVA